MPGRFVAMVVEVKNSRQELNTAIKIWLRAGAAREHRWRDLMCSRGH